MQVGADCLLGQRRSPQPQQPHAAVPIFSLPLSQAGPGAGSASPDGCRTHAHSPCLPGKHSTTCWVGNCLLLAAGEGQRWDLGVTLCYGLERNGGKEEQRVWMAGAGRSCLTFFSCKKNRAEVRHLLLAGPLSWGAGPASADGGMGLHIPLPHPLVGVWLPVCGQWPIWCAWGADPPTPLPSAFSQQQSTVPKVPASLLSRMAQMSPGLAPGSSPSQVLLHTVDMQPGPLQVPKAEQLSPPSACGESGALQGAPRGTGIPAERLDQTLWEF